MATPSAGHVQIYNGHAGANTTRRDSHHTSRTDTVWEGAYVETSFSMGLSGKPCASYSVSSCSRTATADGHSGANGCASSYDASCGGARFALLNFACEHKGGTETVEQLSGKSQTQRPGHITKGRTHMCKHTGTLPPTGMISSRLCGVVHRGNTEAHIIPM